MRHTHQRAFGNTRHIIDIALNFSWVHVVTTTDDQVFAATNNHHITARIDLADISGFEETICCEFFLGLFRHTPVTRKNIRAFDLDTTDFTDR